MIQRDSSKNVFLAYSASHNMLVAGAHKAAKLWKSNAHLM